MMFRTVCILACLSLPASAATGEATSTTTVNFRAGPDTASEILAVVPADSAVTVTSCSEQWCEVVYNNERGYISELYLSFQFESAFVDDFQRPDTRDGEIGPGYDLRTVYAGSFPLPNSDYGRLEDGRFVAGPSETVYASRAFSAPVLTMSASVSWVVNPSFSPDNPVTGGATAALIVSSDDKLIETKAMHVTANRAGVSFQKRTIEGGFVTLGVIERDRLSIQNDGNAHELLASINTNGDWVLRLDAEEIRGNDPELPSLVGPYAVWQIFHAGSNHVDLVRFEEVGASVEPATEG